MNFKKLSYLKRVYHGFSQVSEKMIKLSKHLMPLVDWLDLGYQVQ